jgi:hypothetical protein
MRHAISVLLFGVGVALCGSVFAGETWLCYIASAVAVDEDGTVGPPDLGGLERPTFFRVDADKKEVTILAPPSRRGEVTKIDSISQGQGFWRLAGVEDARSWSLIIAAAGQITLSITSDGVVWSGFGAALAESDYSAGAGKEQR